MAWVRTHPLLSTSLGRSIGVGRELGIDFSYVLPLVSVRNHTVQSKDLKGGSTQRVQKLYGPRASCMNGVEPS